MERNAIVMEEHLQRMSDGLDQVAELLGKDELEPDPARNDFSNHASGVAGLHRAFEDSVLEPFHIVRAELDRALQNDLAGRVVSTGGSVVAVLHAAGERSAASVLMSKLVDLAPPDRRAEIVAGQRDMEHFTRLCHARWLGKTAKELAALWQARRREMSVVMTLHEATTGAHGAAITAALRARPEIAEAARLARATTGEQPELRHWVLGRIAGDVELEKRGEQYFTRAAYRARIEIEARLIPGDRETQALWKLFESHPSN